MSKLVQLGLMVAWIVAVNSLRVDAREPEIVELRVDEATGAVQRTARPQTHGLFSYRAPGAHFAPWKSLKGSPCLQ